MKILVPIDLYESSHAAYEYAIHFANSINAEITLLHVVNSVFNTSDVVAYDPYLEMKNTAKTRLNKYVSQYKSDSGLPLPKVTTHIEVTFGIPGFAISEYAENNKFDLIIMGVRDKHGILDRILGSASTETIKEADCPVLLIHPSTKYKSPKKILFAFDKKTDLDDVLDDFKKLNNKLTAKTDFLHINIQHEDDINEQKSEIVEELFEKEDPLFAFEIKSLSGKKIISGLKDYCNDEHIDMVSMIQRDSGIFANFLSPNKSVKIAQEFQLPVLVFQED